MIQSHYSKNLSLQAGFTIIELLVVISIISLLGSIVLTNVSNARIKAKDVVRVGNSNSIQKAIELYREDTGLYPYITNGAIISSCSSGSTELAPYLAPYITLVPSDACFIYIGTVPPAHTLISYRSGACISISDGYYFANQLLDSTNPNSAAQHDGGVTNGYYEVFGGNIILGSSPSDCH